MLDNRIKFKLALWGTSTKGGIPARLGGESFRGSFECSLMVEPEKPLNEVGREVAEINLGIVTGDTFSWRNGTKRQCW